MEVAENIVFKCSRTHYADDITISLAFFLVEQVAGDEVESA